MTKYLFFGVLALCIIAFILCVATIIMTHKQGSLNIPLILCGLCIVTAGLLTYKTSMILPDSINTFMGTVPGAVVTPAADEVTSE